MDLWQLNLLNTFQQRYRTPNRPGTKLAIEAGATVSDSIESAVNSAQIIFTCLGDVLDVEEVLLGSKGTVNFAPANSIVVDTSTIGPQSARKICSALNSRNIRFLDAPVSGGDIGAQEGSLTFMIGGDEDDFKESQPYLEKMGSKIVHCGPSGAGQAVKLCNQILCAINTLALSEAMILAESQRIDPKVLVDVCSTGAGASWILSNLAPRVAQEDYLPGFMIKHMLKDLRLVTEAQDEAELDSPATALAVKLFGEAQSLDNGQGDKLGTQSLVRFYREKE